MTLTELREAVRLEMQLDPGLISNAERTRFINAAIKDLSTIGLWYTDKLYEGVTGTSVTLPEGLDTIVDIYWNSRRLRPVERKAPPGEVTGDPIGFIPVGSRLDLYPEPVAAGKLYLEYTYTGAELVLDEDEPNFHINVDMLIINHAVALAHRKNGNVSMYREYMGYYEAKKQQLIDRLTREMNTKVRNSHGDEMGETYVRTALDELL